MFIVILTLFQLGENAPRLRCEGIKLTKVLAKHGAFTAQSTPSFTLITP